MNNTSWLSAVTLGLVFGSPWLLGSIYYLQRLGRDDAARPSLGEQLRNRLLS